MKKILELIGGSSNPIIGVMSIYQENGKMRIGRGVACVIEKCGTSSYLAVTVAHNFYTSGPCQFLFFRQRGSSLLEQVELLREPFMFEECDIAFLLISSKGNITPLTLKQDPSKITTPKGLSFFTNISTLEKKRKILQLTREFAEKSLLSTESILEAYHEALSCVYVIAIPPPMRSCPAFEEIAFA